MVSGTAKEGFAVKRGSKGFFSQFAKNKRYFILDVDGLLVYGPGADQARSAGKHIDLFLSRLVEKPPAALEIVTAERAYSLQFATPTERDEWRSAFLAAQQRRVEQVEQLVARLEGVLEKHAARSGKRPDGKPSSEGAPKGATPAQTLEYMTKLTARLEKLADA